MSDVIKHIKSEIKFLKENIELKKSLGHDASYEEMLMKSWKKELKKEERKLNS